MCYCARSSAAACRPDLLDDNDPTLERNVRAEIGSLLGVNAEPLLVRLQRHRNSMPQYHIGHQARIQRIESALDSHANFALAGSAYHGVGIGDCVRSGEQAAEKLFQQIVTTGRSNSLPLRCANRKNEPNS